MKKNKKKTCLRGRRPRSPGEREPLPPQELAVLCAAGLLPAESSPGKAPPSPERGTQPQVHHRSEGPAEFPPKPGTYTKQELKEKKEFLSFCISLKWTCCVHAGPFEEMLSRSKDLLPLDTGVSGTSPVWFLLLAKRTLSGVPDQKYTTALHEIVGRLASGSTRSCRRSVPVGRTLLCDQRCQRGAMPERKGPEEAPVLCEKWSVPVTTTVYPDSWGRLHATL
ncbi:hypothetical protein H920_00119 [Fukomys damarensis]|uniref:Uncharacterized protein n=1 Tax=Fukomys damarensis TaxID=885580 RepID=A0A091E776_FUKDA|nr:hypothetical protein H920_00119 [Fukomys damarensis]